MAAIRACARRISAASCSTIAARLGVPREQVLLGGDHLGPNCWQDLPAEAAMAKSEQLIADYVARGLSQDSSGLLHVLCGRSDAAHRCRSWRRARRGLCAVAEQTWQRAGGEAPVYVVGTEVPVPGGAKEALTELALTEPHGRDRNHRRALGGVSIRGICTMSGRA